MFILTRNSAIAEGPRDASCQLKTCAIVGGDRSNFAEIFGTRKLESLGYRVVLFL